jgi:hypothetical protein
MILTSNCMSCKEEVCIRCHGDHYKAERILVLLQARNQIIHKGKTGRVDNCSGIARITQIDQKLQRLQHE